MDSAMGSGMDSAMGSGMDSAMCSSFPQRVRPELSEVCLIEVVAHAWLDIPWEERETSFRLVSSGKPCFRLS